MHSQDAPHPEPPLSRPDRIAIIGWGCLVPGAANPAQFWQNLLDERDATSLADAEQLGVSPSVFAADRPGQTDRLHWLRGGFVRGFRLDARGLALPPERLAALDVQDAWSLEAGRQALEDGGYFGTAGAADALSRCGLVLGSLSFPTRRSARLFGPLYGETVGAAVGELLGVPLQLPVLPELPGTAGSTAEDGMLSGQTAALVARALGLSGPAFCLDAACASTLYALELAARSLQAGRADMMLAGAVSGADPLTIMTGFSIFNAYPEPDGASRPLDQTTGGLISGEGAGLFLLKREADALRDGDHIYATILGTGLSNDGRGRHPLAPNPQGQQHAFERAYSRAGVSPGSVQYVECHATGTPLGDATELASLEQFFGGHGAAPLLGSVKSNLGHLLTAAGVPGVIKSVLSLREGTIPATRGVQQPMSGPGGQAGGTGVVRRATPWPEHGGPRRAGVSAFGFGGTNAHLILEGPATTPAPMCTPAAQPTPTARRPFEPLAIVGVGARFGPWEDWQSYWRAVNAGRPAAASPPPGRWRGLDAAVPAGSSDSAPPGAYLESFAVDPRRLRTPLADGDRPIPQQLLLLTVADAAIRDAGLTEGGNVAVVAAMGTDLSLHQYRGRLDLAWQVPAALAAAGLELPPDELAALERLAKDCLHGVAGVNQYVSFIGNIMATRVSALWDFSGPAFTVSNDACSVARALDVAALLLADPEIEAVVVAAVDLAGGAEAVYLQQHVAAQGGRDAAMWQPGEGAGALVLKRGRQAQQDGSRVYAVVESVAISNRRGAPSRPGADSAEVVVGAGHEALALAHLAPHDIGLLDVAGSGPAPAPAATLSTLIPLYAAEARPIPLAVASTSETAGRAGVAGGMASLLTVTLALWHRTLPGLTSPPPALAETATSCGFELSGEPRPWMLRPGQERRRAALAVSGEDGDGNGGAAHVILSEPPTLTSQPGQPTQTLQRPGRPALVDRTDLCLLPLAADDLSGLLRLLDAAEESLLAGVAPAALMRQQAEALRAGLAAGRALRLAALVGRGCAELLDEVRRARAALPAAERRGAAWESRRGSYYTPRPLGPHAEVAFVYPGGYNSYVGLGRGLFGLVPELHDALRARVADLSWPLRASLLYPAAPGPLSRERLAAAEARLRAEPVALLESAISFGVLTTTLLREQLGIRPARAFGYSTGESTMLLALGVWPDCERSSRTLNDSPLFKTQIVGQIAAARAYLTEQGHPFDPADPWGCYLLKAPITDVAAALEREPLASLAIINTPGEAVISGDPAACLRIIAALGCHHLRVAVSTVAHTVAARSEYAALLTLHRQPVDPTVTIPCYTAATLAPLPLESDAIARAISDLQYTTLDFPALVERVYADGARIFIEPGPGSTCTGWISETLGDRPHLACSVNRRGVDDDALLFRLGARLLAHGTPLDLDALFGPSETAAAPVAALSASAPSASASRAAALPADRRVQIALGGADIGATIKAADPEPFRRALRPAVPAAAAPGVVAGHVPVPVRTDAPPPAPVPLFAPAAFDLPGNPDHSLLGELGSLVRAGHTTFLQARTQQIRQLAELVALQTDALGQWQAADYPSSAPTQPATLVSGAHTSPSVPARRQPAVIWDAADLLEFASGSIAAVFGPEYAVIDTYARRVRLPMPPYLLVSRVTRLFAEGGRFEPCSITTEYDVPVGAWYTVDGQAPLAIAVEAGQCDLLLISYLGIDFEARGERVYRLLDCTLTFLDDLPREGDTLRYDITINSFARNGDSLLFFFSYECFVGDRKVLVMDGGCAGFFTDAELEGGGGIILTESEFAERRAAARQEFQPRLTCPRTAFDRAALERLSAGDVAAVFGQEYAQPGRNPSLRLPPPAMLMLDRVVSVDPQGGPWGLGLVEAEQDLRPDDWYFPCHFKDDQVLAGSLMGDSCAQLLQFYLLYLGLQRDTVDARFQPVPGLRQAVRCRGQVTPTATRLHYRLEVTALGTSPQPYAHANVMVSLDGKPIVQFKDLGIRLVDQSPPLFTERQVQEFATGSMSACFGPEFDIYADRRTPRTPNGDLQLLSRVLAVDGQRGVLVPGASLRSAYDVPPDAWFYRQNSCPTAPYSILMEIGLQPCGFLSAHLGSSFVFPDLDFRFRNLDGWGRLLHEVDLRGRTVDNTVRLLESTTLDGLIIQKFAYELSVDGVPFSVGEASFGYFTDGALAAQTGLDRGAETEPWYRTPAGDSAAAQGISIDLRTAAGLELFAGTPDRPAYCLAGGHLDFLDGAIVVPDGGRHGLGYVWARRQVDPASWFYACHFFQDPVMPGSLGVEAILEALQVFALQRDLGRTMRAPHFAPLTDHRTVWKYRGQILPGDPELSLEVHITQREWRAEGGWTIIGDASLWKGRLRIYEITGAAIVLLDDSP